MKKIKLALVCMAVIVGVTGAFGTKSVSTRNFDSQYFQYETPWGNFYGEAGVEGVDFLCDYCPYEVCTWREISTGLEYYWGGGYNDPWSNCSGDNYTPSKYGRYIPLNGRW